MKRMTVGALATGGLVAALGIAGAWFLATRTVADAPRQAPAAAPVQATATPLEQVRRTEAIVRTRVSMLDSYDALVREAEAGNADAAFQLFQDASRCENLELKEQILVEHAARAGDDASDQVVRELAEDRRLCEGMDGERLARKNEWVVRAARLGNTEAQVLYFGAVTEHIRTPEDIVANAEELAAYKQEAMRHLRSAAAKGNDTALFNMALAYNDGTLADRDPVMAYAHMLALRNRGSTRAADTYLEAWSRDMTAEQLRVAGELSLQYGH